MNRKKLIALALSMVLALSLAVPAFAFGTSSSSGSSSTPTTTPSPVTYAIDINGQYEDIPLSVLIIGTGKAVINPYGIPYEIEFESENADLKSMATGDSAVIAGSGITTEPLAVVNLTAAKLNVGATITVDDQKGGVKIYKEADINATGGQTVDDKKPKGVYGVTLEVAPFSLTATQGAGTLVMDPSLVDPSKINEKGDDRTLFLDVIAAVFADNTVTWASPQKLTIGTGATDINDANTYGSATMKATAGSYTAGTNGLVQLEAYDSVNYGSFQGTEIGLFRVSAKVPADPHAAAESGYGAEDPWTAKDTVNLSIVFNFALGT